jgi:hypothetical protein
MQGRPQSHPPPYELSMATSNLPTRTNTGASHDEEAVPEGDPSSTGGLLLERLQAWKHMVVYLEDYIGAVGKGQNSEAKEHEKVLKARNLN